MSNAIVAGLAALVGGGRWYREPGRPTLLALLIVVTVAGYGLLRELVKQTGLLIEDRDTDREDLHYLVPDPGRDWNSALRIPVAVGQQLLGLLCADAKEARALDESHLQMLIAIGNLFALGMRNANRAVRL